MTNRTTASAYLDDSGGLYVRSAQSVNGKPLVDIHLCDTAALLVTEPYAEQLYELLGHFMHGRKASNDETV